jgi:DNA-binding transcriptional regulator YiaG
MANLVATLKAEIRRLARKEIKSELNATRRAATQHRRDIAQLKRVIRAQEKRIAALQAGKAGAVPQPQADDGVPQGTRFSAKSVRSQRARLKLSAAEYGKLVGVSGQTIYLWEQGKTRPGKAQFARLVAIRGIGRRAALGQLEESQPSE